MRAGGRCSGTGSNDDQAHDGKRGEARQRERARSSLEGQSATQRDRGWRRRRPGIVRTAISPRDCYMWRVSIASLQRQLRDFAVERDWEQFHTPKNLVMALAGEVGELTEIFQWLTPDESADVMVEAASAGRVREEMADVLAYLLRLSDVLGVDLEAALAKKIVKNAVKYPVETAQGVATKYTDLSSPQKPSE